MPSSGTSQRPRIAHIVSRFPALTETFVLYELTAMERLGVEVELYPLMRAREGITHPEAGPWMKRAHYCPFLSMAVVRAQWRFIRREPARYFRVWKEVLSGTWGSANFFLGAIAIFPKAVQFAAEIEGRVRHVHAQFANHPAVAALIIHRLTGIPFSFTARGTDIQVNRQMLKEKVQAAEFAIAVSLYNKRILVGEGGPAVRDKVHVTYGGVDVRRLSPRAFPRAPGPFRILCVSRFEEVKGHKILVEACRTLRDAGIAFKCCLIGDGPLLPTVEKQITELGLSNEVRLRGACTYPEVVEALKRADVVALPTAPTSSGKVEGIPNVLKEAMACGLPVVASSVGAIPELVDDEGSGILVPPKDPASLADALQRLAADPGLRRRLGRAGRQKVVREFNLEVSTLKRAQLFLGGTGLDVLLAVQSSHAPQVPAELPLQQHAQTAGEPLTCVE